MEFDKEVLMAALIVGAGGHITINKEDLDYVIGKSIVLDIDEKSEQYSFTVEEQA